MPRLLSWLRLSRPPWLGPLPALYLSLLLTLCALLVWRPLYPYLDFWGHAAVGRWSWEHGEVPRQALFLWTWSGPWVAHSWLTQLTFYGLTRVAGEGTLPYVVLGFTCVMVAIPFVLIWDLWGRRGRIGCWVVLPFALALEICHPSFQTR